MFAIDLEALALEISWLLSETPRHFLTKPDTKRYKDFGPRVYGILLGSTRKLRPMNMITTGKDTAFQKAY